MKNITLYLVRHGQTEWNLQDRMQGTQNSELTEEGVQGAIITGDYLRETPFIAGYSSDLKRAIETRDYILDQNNHSNIPRFIEPRLQEIHYGAWEGQSTQKLKEDPEFLIYFHEPEKYEGLSNGGETYFNALARIEAGLRAIIAETKTQEGNILVVSHGAILRLLLRVFQGGSVADHRDDSVSERILNTSLSYVTYQGPSDGSGQFSVGTFNNVDHLPKA